MNNPTFLQRHRKFFNRLHYTVRLLVLYSLIVILPLWGAAIWIGGDALPIAAFLSLVGFVLFIGCFVHYWGGNVSIAHTLHPKARISFLQEGKDKWHICVSIPWIRWKGLVADKWFDNYNQEFWRSSLEEIKRAFEQEREKYLTRKRAEGVINEVPYNAPQSSTVNELLALLEKQVQENPELNKGVREKLDSLKKIAKIHSQEAQK